MGVAPSNSNVLVCYESINTSANKISWCASARSVSMLDVTWHINSQQDLFHASKILAGLSALRRKGELSLQFIPNTNCPEIRGSTLVLLTIRKGDRGSERTIIVDLADTSEFHCPVALNYADIYFKRNLLRGPLELLPIYLQMRVRPFGLNFPCVEVESWTDWLGASIVRARMTAASDLRSAIGGFINDLHLFVGIPSHNSFIAHPEGHKRAIALFQTRVWPPEKSSDDLELLNKERVELVMILRGALGERFVGGVIDSEFARVRYPNVVVRESIRRRAYITLTRSALIGVYSRGVHGSLAFKLSEYLAAGCCIVAEPWEHRLDLPLENGIHYLPYHSADSCASVCKTLLDDKRLAAEMSRRNAEYFQRYVVPERHIGRMLATDSRLFDV